MMTTSVLVRSPITPHSTIILNILFTSSIVNHNFRNTTSLIFLYISQQEEKQIKKPPDTSDFSSIDSRIILYGTFIYWGSSIKYSSIPLFRRSPNVHRPYSRRMSHDRMRPRPMRRTIAPSTRMPTMTITMAGNATKIKNASSVPRAAAQRRLVRKDRCCPPPIRI